jgi:hypothetical protein
MKGNYKNRNDGTIHRFRARSGLMIRGWRPAVLLALAVLLCAPPTGPARGQTNTPNSCDNFFRADEPSDQKTIDRERDAWKAICQNGLVEVSKVAAAAELDRLPADQRDNHVLSAAFLKAMLTQRPNREQIRGRGFIIKGAVFTDEVDLQDLIVEGPVAFLNCEFKQSINLSRSHFAHSVSFVGSILGGGLTATGAQIAGSLMVGGSDQPSPPISRPLPVRIASINARGVRVTGELNIRDAQIAGIVDLLNIRSGGSVNVTRVEGHELVLAAGEIRGQLAVLDSIFQPTPEIMAADGPFYSVLNLNFTHVSQDTFLNRSDIRGPLHADGAEIGGSLVLMGTTLNAALARGAVIKGALRMGFSIPLRNEPARSTRWVGESSLNLTNATIGRIVSPRSLEYWPRTLMLTGMKVGAFDLDRSGAPGQMAEKWSDWFEKWLLRQSEFASQPYHHVRTILATAGDDLTAARIGYAGRDRELRESIRQGQLLHAVYLSLSKILIGYGYMMWLPLLWMAAIVALGMQVFKRSEESKTEPGCRFDPLFYSIDLFLPLLQLRRRHFECDLKSKARYYFYFHRVAGWVIGSFIIVGLAGFTK